jgi:hypothetical protein
VNEQWASLCTKRVVPQLVPFFELAARICFTCPDEGHEADPVAPRLFFAEIVMKLCVCYNSCSRFALEQSPLPTSVLIWCQSQAARAPPALARESSATKSEPEVKELTDWVVIPRTAEV